MQAFRVIFNGSVYIFKSGLTVKNTVFTGMYLTLINYRTLQKFVVLMYFIVFTDSSQSSAEEIV